MTEPEKQLLKTLRLENTHLRKVLEVARRERDQAIERYCNLADIRWRDSR